MADITLQQFEEAANMGSALWEANIGNRQTIPLSGTDAIEIMWGAVPIDGSSGVVSSIATHTANNFQYTSGIYGAPVPGSGDSTLTMHRFTMVFPDAQKSAKDIVPLIVQFQRCPIIPVLSAELIKEGITALAQLQCNISTLDDTPGGIKLEFLCGEVDVSLYTGVVTPGEDQGNAIVDNANYSLWHITNYPLLKWFVYDFHNESDPRFMSIKEDGGASIRDMMDKIETKLQTEGGVSDAIFHMSHLSEEYLNMFAAFNEVMMAIVSFMSNPAAYVSSGGTDPLEDLIDYIRNNLVGRRDYGPGNAAVDGMLNEVEGMIRNYFSLMVQDENPRLTPEENEQFQNEVVRVIGNIMELQSSFITTGDELSGFFKPVGGDSVCNSVSLQLVNQFKPLPLSNTSSQMWQYLGPGRGGLVVELTTDESDGPSLGAVRNMFRNIADSIAGVMESATAPASLAFTRVITWPTILANKLYFVPDTMATSTVPGFPTLRTVSLQFSMFDGDIVERAKAHKMFENNLLQHTQVSAEALETGSVGYAARDISNQASHGIGSFYDLYLPWFVADEAINNINSFPIELPTWSEVVGAQDGGSFLNHMSYDDILSIYRGTSVNASPTDAYQSNSSDISYVPINVQHSGQGLMSTVMTAYAPPDFWCHHNKGSLISRFLEGMEDPLMIDYGSEESEETAEAIKNEIEKPKMAWSKTSPYWVDWELADHLEDEMYYGGKLSLTRCFPSAYFLFSSHATMGFGIFLQDIGWGYGMLEDMSIMERGDIPVDTAVIRLVNMFGKLDDPMFGGGGLISLFLGASFGDRLRMRDAINGGMNDSFGQDLRDWWYQAGANISETWRSAWQWTGQWPTHAEEAEADLRRARSTTDVLPLAPGMWAHVRMGYGQPYQHATVFNGRIADYKPGDVVQIECESFGADLTKLIPASSDDKHNCEPRKDMCRVLNKPLSGIRGFLWNISQPGCGVKSAIAAGSLSGSFGTSAGGLVIANAISNHMISKGIPLWYPTEGLGESIFTSQLAIQATGAEGGSQSRGTAGFGMITQQTGGYHLISSTDREISLPALIMGTPGDPSAVGAQCELGINIYNASPLADPGVNQLGIGWADNSEDPTAGNSGGKRDSQEALTSFITAGGAVAGAAGGSGGAAAVSSLADEVAFGYSYYGRSLVDYGTTCARLTGDYIFTVVPIANRCTIYYGKPDWPVWYELKPMGSQEYGEDGNTTAGDVIAIRRPFDQYSLHGVTDIIYNDIVAQKDFATGVKPAWSRGKPGNMADQTKGVFWEMGRDAVDAFWAEDGTFSQIPIQWFDADIHPAEKRVIQEDTQILKIVGGVVPEGTGAVTTVVGVVVGIIAAIAFAGSVLGAVGIALLVTLAIKLIVSLLGWLWKMIDLLFEYVIGIDVEDIFAWGERIATEETIAMFDKYDIPARFLSNMKGVYWAQVSGVTKGILKEEVETMYRGSLYVVGTPVPRPHRSQFIADPKTGMTGGFVADTVVHHFSVNSGFVTEIIPKVKTTVWDVGGMAKWITNASRVNRILGGLALGYFSSKLAAISLYSSARTLGALTKLPAVLDALEHVMRSKKWTLAADVIKRYKRGGAVADAYRFGRSANRFGQGVKNIGTSRMLAYGGKAAKLIKLAEAVAFLIVEAAFGMFMAAWSETIRAARGCYIAPISKHGRPFVAGINGWRGCVIMNGEMVNASGDDLAAQGQGVYGGFLALFVGV
jgi:hypothetical protein